MSILRVLTLVRAAWTFAFGAAIFAITLASYLLGLAVAVVPGVIAVGVYGVLTWLHLLLQVLFAVLNRLEVDRASRRARASQYKPRTAVQIVGWRENATLFEACLRSVDALAHDVGKVVFVSDGNEPDDMYLADVFLKVFPDAAVMRLDYVLTEVGKARREELYRKFQAAGKHVCILQPHRHKRHAMYTAFRCLIDSGIELIVPTDSDTVFFPNTVSELAAVMADPDVTAATGEVGIFNVENWLSWLSNKRYWFAFNLERAAQSYFRCVSCISGPLGAYRASALELVIEDWVKQTFLGRECTYGEDRHLTARLLKRGLRVVYTHRARCLTETPTTYRKWLRQQTRWSRSFNRELLLNLTYLHRHSRWMTYDLVTQGIFPLFLAASMAAMAAQAIGRGNWAVAAVFLGTVLLGGLVRSTFAMILTRDWRFLGFAGYGLMYVGGLLWCRIYALPSIYHTGWSTPYRKADSRFERYALGSEGSEVFGNVRLAAVPGGPHAKPGQTPTARPTSGEDSVLKPRQRAGR